MSVERSVDARVDSAGLFDGESMGVPAEGVMAMPSYRIVVDRERCVGDGLCRERADGTYVNRAAERRRRPDAGTH